MRSADGSSGSVDAHAEAVHPAPARRTSSAPASPTSHVPSRPGSSTSPVARVQLARVVVDEVAEQAERGALRPASAAPARGRTTFAPRWA